LCAGNIKQTINKLASFKRVWARRTIGAHRR